MKIYLIIILPLAMLIFCCRSINSAFHTPLSYEQQLDTSWIGKNKHDVYIDYGAPVKIIDDGEYGEVLVYDKIDTYLTIRTITSVTKTTNSKDVLEKTHKSETEYPISNTKIISTQFFINKSGKVYKCKYFN